MVAEEGSLLPQFRGSISESGRQTVHETAARARFHIEIHKAVTFGVLLEDEVAKICIIRL